MSPVYINTVSHPPRRPARTDQRTDQSRATQTPARLATGGWREILRWLFRPPSAEAQRSWRRLSEIARLAAFPTGMSRNLLPKQLRLIMELDGIHERDIEGPPYGPKP
ncbi:hypothetical protein CIHG_06353 [Coccidioides immitis H538.4]|uniref:Uncharacterized protein n=1 Tax=Coccidioides immitis H538.4 TaxID=396776 RepID=A0A0J8ULX1_COCIT|nr:hypothetical protein CIHG_06353 [Coccidioides immitis H538.4]